MIDPSVMSQAEKLALRERLLRRTLTFEPDDFPHAAAFVRDDARFKLLFGPRRIGKTISITCALLKAAWNNPRSRSIYLGLTIASALDAVWDNGLKIIAPALGLKVSFNETHHTCTLENRSVVAVLGADAADVAERLRGGKRAAVAIDEAQSFLHVDLRDLYFKILRPSLMDLKGTMILSGTPGPAPTGFFFDLTKDHELADQTWTHTDQATATTWSCHRWGVEHNPHVAARAAEEDAKLRAENPRIVLTSGYRQETLGHWVSKSGLVYGGFTEANFYDDLPRLQPSGWHHVLGIDLGWRDKTAFVVGSWHDHDRRLFIRQTESQSEMTLTAVANRIKEFQSGYEFDAIVVDGANKQGVEEINLRLGLTLLSADKTAKSDHIFLLNDELVLGNVVLQRDAASGLAKIFKTLTWRENRLNPQKFEEDPRGDNHESDACLYLFRFCHPYTSKAPRHRAKPGERGYADQLREAQEAEAREMDRKIIERVEMTKQRRDDAELFGHDPYASVGDEPDPYAGLNSEGL